VKSGIFEDSNYATSKLWFSDDSIQLFITLADHAYFAFKYAVKVLSQLIKGRTGLRNSQVVRAPRLNERAQLPWCL